ncbi:MAG: hypothetical protein ACRDRL_21125 [Sciscionella sp.]
MKRAATTLALLLTLGSTAGCAISATAAARAPAGSTVYTALRWGQHGRLAGVGVTVLAPKQYALPSGQRAKPDTRYDRLQVVLDNPGRAAVTVALTGQANGIAVHPVPDLPSPNAAVPPGQRGSRTIVLAHIVSATGLILKVDLTVDDRPVSQHLYYKGGI